MASVVLLVTHNSDGKIASLGSGFFVRRDVIATNYHVIKNASKIYCRLIGKTSIYAAELLRSDTIRDLALIKIKYLTAPPLVFGDSNKLAVGDDVYVVGNPEGLEGTFSQGIISSFREIKAVRHIQITAPISPGSSGGPVLDKTGRVIGIAAASLVEGQNLNFAVPASYLSSLLKDEFIWAVSPEEFFAKNTGALLDDSVIRRYLQTLGATVDESKSKSNMIVSKHIDLSHGEVTIVIVNDRTRNLIGFYIYNFGNAKQARKREDIYGYLLSTNDTLTIGSFFVDNDGDIGYKYFLNNQLSISQTQFEQVYLTMASVAGEHRVEIRRLLGF